MTIFIRKFMFLSLIVLSFFSATPVGAVEAEPKGQIVYIDDEECTDCQIIKSQGIIEGLIDQGYEVIIYQYEDRGPDNMVIWAYRQTYGVTTSALTPMIFAGDTYFVGSSNIIKAFNDGVIQENALTPLLDVSEFIVPVYGFWGGLIRMVVGGLLDGINPCAIAMLLMFISMVGFTKSRKILMIVSSTYIITIFATYFLIGIGFLSLLGISRSAIPDFSFYLYGGFALLCFGLFVLTFYDFLVTRKQEYGKVKSQLPKFIKTFNARITKHFTDALDNNHGKTKRMISLIGAPIIIGVIVGITEAACTGAIYFAVLTSIEASNPFGGITFVEIFYILVFNIMFLVPLIVIVIVAIKVRSIAGISNFVREKMPLIKILTSIFFLIMAIYFILMFFEVPWVYPDYYFNLDIL